MCVSAVGGVRGALVVDEGVGGDVFVDEEGGDADAEAGEVVCGVVGVGEAGEGEVVGGGWDVGGWRDVVCEAAVLRGEEGCVSGIGAGGTGGSGGPVGHTSSKLMIRRVSSQY